MKQPLCAAKHSMMPAKSPKSRQGVVREESEVKLMFPSRIEQDVLRCCTRPSLKTSAAYSLLFQLTWWGADARS